MKGINKNLYVKREKKEIWLNPITKTLIPIENSKTNVQHKNVIKKFDYTTIVDRLRTVSWSNDRHPTGVVKLSINIGVWSKQAYDIFFLEMLVLCFWLIWSWK